MKRGAKERRLDDGAEDCGVASKKVSCGESRAARRPYREINVGIFDFFSTRGSSNVTISGSNSGVVIVNGKVVSGGGGVSDAGVVETRSIAVESFEELEGRGSMRIEWEPSAEPFCRVTADRNILALIEGRVQGGRLVISASGSFSTNAEIVVRTGSPKLSAALVAGSGDILANGVEGKAFSGSVSGSGDLEISGVVESAALVIKGSGNIDARDMEAEDLSATVRGSGDIKANASRRADAMIQGSGDIKIKGDAPIQNQSVTGSGSVRFARKGPKP